MNKSRFLLPFTFLIIVLMSCSNQGPSSQTAAGKHLRDTTRPIDTTLYLKFTSGVRSILEDSRGHFWFGSHQEGVARYDPSANSGQGGLTYFTVEDGLSHMQVRTILEDPAGLIWFEGGKGLSSFDGATITTHTERDYRAKYAWRKAPNDLWFKGDEGTGFNQMEGHPGVYRYDGTQLIFHAFPIHLKEGEEFYYSVSTPAVKGKNGRVWFGTYGAVIGYDGMFFTIIDNDLLGLNEETGFLHVRSIFEDSQGNLWIGNNGIGVLKYDGDTTVNFSKLNGLVPEDSPHRGNASPPGSLEHVFSIAEDRDGNLWFGDRDTGAWKYDGKSLQNYTREDGLTSTHIWAIYRDKKDELWFAMADGSVCRFNGESFDRIF